MLKLRYCQSKEHNHWYFTFIDEFSKKVYDGKTFYTIDEAVAFANDNITYKGDRFDLPSINSHQFEFFDLDNQ